MRAAIGIAGTVGALLAAALVGGVPAHADSAGTVVEPDAADFQSREVADGVAVQQLALHPGVHEDADPPAVTPPDWASAQAKWLAADEPDVLTAQTAVDPFQLAAVTWTGDRKIVAWVRTRSAQGWSRWYQLPEADEHAPDPGSAEAEQTRSGTDPLLVAESDAVQVRVSVADRSHRLPDDLRLDLTGAEPLPQDGDQAPRTQTPSARAFGEDPDTEQFDIIDQLRAPRHTIYNRAAWGADESMAGTPEYAEVNGGFVHHTVSTTDYTAAQVPAMIRSIYAYHVNGRGWKDIGYNFLVDKFDRVWEGRKGGVARPVVGAHTLGYNDDAFAASAIGTYSSTPPTAGMKVAFERLFAWKFSVHGVDPRYPVYYDGERFNAVSGHRDAGATDCPGDALYARLPSMRDQITWRMSLEPSRDLNQDVRPDIMMTKSDGTLWYAPGRLDGRYYPAERVSSGWTANRLPTIAGDLRRDRYDELLAIRKSNGYLYSYPGGPDGTFGPPTALGGGWNAMRLLAAPGDTNGDGYRDIVAVRGSDGYLFWYQGTSSGGYHGYRLLSRSWAGNDVMIAAGDWNRDGHNDLIARNRYSGNLWLVVGNGNGTFRNYGIMSGGWKGHDIVGAGDMDGDGLPDLAVRRPDGSLWRYPGNGIGSFKTPVRLGGAWIWDRYNYLF